MNRVKFSSSYGWYHYWNFQMNQVDDVILRESERVSPRFDDLKSCKSPHIHSFFPSFFLCVYFTKLSPRSISLPLPSSFSIPNLTHLYVHVFLLPRGGPRPALPCPALPCPALPRVSRMSQTSPADRPSSRSPRRWRPLQETEAHLSHGFLTHTRRREREKERRGEPPSSPPVMRCFQVVEW